MPGSAPWDFSCVPRHDPIAFGLLGLGCRPSSDGGGRVQSVVPTSRSCRLFQKLQIWPCLAESCDYDSPLEVGIIRPFRIVNEGRRHPRSTSWSRGARFHLTRTSRSFRSHPSPISSDFPHPNRPSASSPRPASLPACLAWPGGMPSSWAQSRPHPSQISSAQSFHLKLLPRVPTKYPIGTPVCLC